jgi:hypothetical protein
MLKHPREALVILEHVDIFKGNFAPGEILTGSRSVGSEILAEDKNRFAGHRCCSFHRLISRYYYERQTNSLFFTKTRVQERVPLAKTVASLLEFAISCGNI